MDFIEKLFSNSPGLAAACFIAFIFLRHLKLRDEAQIQAETKRDSTQSAFVAKLVDTCHEHSTASTQAILSCSQAHIKQTEVLGKVKAALDESTVVSRLVRDELKRQN